MAEEPPPGAELIGFGSGVVVPVWFVYGCACSALGICQVTDAKVAPPGAVTIA